MCGLGVEFHFKSRQQPSSSPTWSLDQRPRYTEEIWQTKGSRHHLLGQGPHGTQEHFDQTCASIWVCHKIGSPRKQAGTWCPFDFPLNHQKAHPLRKREAYPLSGLNFESVQVSVRMGFDLLAFCSFSLRRSGPLGGRLAKDAGPSALPGHGSKAR